MIPRPAPAMANFGMRVRAGDVDGDERPDLAEGAPSRGGRHRARDLLPQRAARTPALPPAPVGRGQLGLAMGDVNGDGRADIVQGDSEHVDPDEGPPVGSGLVRVWYGGPRRAARESDPRSPRTAPTIPGTAEPGDEFGAVVEAGDVDSDGFADMIVAAVREDEGAGRVIVIRGAPRRLRPRGQHARSTRTSPRAGPSRARPRVRLDAVRAAPLRDDRLPDVAMAARGEDSADERVMVVEGGRGVFAPDETRTRTMDGVASLGRRPGGRAHPPGEDGGELTHTFV